jgi:hypothetical protein
MDTPSTANRPPRGPAARTSPLLEFAARWIGLTNLALVTLILLVQAGDALGQAPVMIGSTATVATWAALSVVLSMKWLASDRPPAWFDLARDADAARRPGR